MRLPKSLDKVQQRFYELRYGEEEACTLMQLHGKEREKRLAMLDEHGVDASRFEAQRELGALFEDSVNAVADAGSVGSHIHFAHLRDAELKELLKTETDPDVIAKHHAELHAIAQTIARLTPQLEELKRISEDKSFTYETASKSFAEKYGEIKPELRLERHREPADLPKTIAAWQQRLVKETTSVFAIILGMPAANKIAGAPPSERWSVAKECMDSQTFEGTPERMTQVREAAVRIISTKNQLVSVRDAIITRMVLAEEIPSPADPKDSGVYKKQLEGVEQLVAIATETVDLTKVLVRWCEMETGKRMSAARPDPAS